MKFSFINKIIMKKQFIFQARQNVSLFNWRKSLIKIERKKKYFVKIGNDMFPWEKKLFYY